MMNIAVNAGFAAARLREKLEGLQVLAIVGYTPVPDDKDGRGRAVAHWRSGIVKQFQPDIFAPEIVLKFQWNDLEGSAEIGVFGGEDIILLIPEQLNQYLLSLN